MRSLGQGALILAPPLCAARDVGDQMSSQKGLHSGDGDGVGMDSSANRSPERPLWEGLQEQLGGASGPQSWGQAALWWSHSRRPSASLQHQLKLWLHDPVQPPWGGGRTHLRGEAGLRQTLFPEAGRRPGSPSGQHGAGGGGPPAVSEARPPKPESPDRVHDESLYPSLYSLSCQD